MAKKRVTRTTKFVVDAYYINHLLSCYHRHGIKHDHMGLEWSERWDFIMKELKASLKRKTYGKADLYEDKKPE
jgi:hypothetical protein